MLTDWDAIEGDWLIALEQHSGRGRQGREWVGQNGNFFGSSLVMVRPSDPSPVSLSLVAGLALIEAAEDAAPGSPLMLKWPNDLLLSGKKLGGILLERSGNRIVAGFGLNLAIAPEVEGRKTAALGAPISPQDFAAMLSASFSKLLALWRSSGPMLMVNAWLARAHPVGTPLTVHAGADDVRSGRFAGIEDDGALKLRTGRGLEIIRAGDVDLA